MMGSVFQFLILNGAVNLLPDLPRFGGKVRLGNPVVCPVTCSLSPTL